MDTQIVEVINVSRAVAWLPWAVQYFFLIGLSVGAWFLALPWLWRGTQETLGRLALLASLVCGLVAPVALLADLHGPGRFYHFYLYLQPHSWMAWGSVFIPLYLGGLMLSTWLAWRGDFARLAGATSGRLARLYRLLGHGGSASRRQLRSVSVLTFAGAALVALYTGMEVMVIQARPLWHTPFLPLQFGVTAVAGAIGLVLVFNRLLGARDHVLEVRLNQLLALSQLLVLALGALWLATGLLALDPVHAVALQQVAQSASWQFTAVWATAATLLTLLIATRWPQGSGLVTGLLALHSAWMIRWTVFIGGQSVPKTGAGFYDYQLPLGNDGLLGIVGTAGLWLALLMILLSYSPWAGTTGRDLTARSAS